MAGCCETCHSYAPPVRISAVTAIDREWFLETLASQNKSVRGLARHMGIDASAMSRMLARIERARKTGEARVVGADAVGREVVLVTASPVIAIIP